MRLEQENTQSARIISAKQKKQPGGSALLYEFPLHPAVHVNASFMKVSVLAGRFGVVQSWPQASSWIWKYPWQPADWTWCSNFQQQQQQRRQQQQEQQQEQEGQYTFSNVHWTCISRNLSNMFEDLGFLLQVWVILPPNIFNSDTVLFWWVFSSFCLSFSTLFQIGLQYLP